MKSELDRTRAMHNQRQLIVILVIVFFGFAGTSLAYPILPPLFLHPLHGSLVPEEWSSHYRSIFLGMALGAYPFGQFMGSPILGGCSDRYGRKCMLMLSLMGTAVGYFLSAFALHINSLWILLASRFLTGVMEGNFAIVQAMAADLEGISKYKTFGRINGIGAVGYVTGPLLGGFLSDSSMVSWFSFGFPFFVAGGFAVLTVWLAWGQLSDTKKPSSEGERLSIWQRFNLAQRFYWLFKRNETLKYLLIISSLFTLSVDMFYEFGPVYLTGLWSMTPAGIAIYNASLSFALAIGSSWLPYYLSRYFSFQRIVVVAILLTALIFAVMAGWPSQGLAYVLFGLVGLSIAVTNTNLTIQVSNSAEKSIQGEVMGSQLSLRMLGDTVICLAGGFMIISSVLLPMIISCVAALLAFAVYVSRYPKVG